MKEKSTTEAGAVESKSAPIDRDGCVECCLKHLGQARAIFLETQKGYPDFKFYVGRHLELTDNMIEHIKARGHMAEAEDEIVELFAPVAEKIRDARVAYQDLGETPDFISLMKLLLVTNAQCAEVELAKRGL